MRSVETALRAQPAHAGALHQKAELLRVLGRYEEALEAIDAALATGAGSIGMDLLRAQVVGVLEGPEPVARMLEERLARGDLPAGPAGSVKFHLAAALEKLGAYDRAFKLVSEANASRASRYDPADTDRFVDDVIATWTPALLRELPRSTNDSAAPVFIVGMPRSGTSLVEQIIASHPLGAGLGEHDGLTAIAHQLLRDESDAWAMAKLAPALTQQKLNSCARKYLNEIKRRNRKATRITNKMPLNLLHCGLIRLLYPAGTILHCERDARDTCISCFFQDFGAQQVWTQSLSHLAAFYRSYERIMAHWRRVFEETDEGGLFDVSYEELVADQEAMSRRMICDMLGLEWDDACLAFHKAKRATVTASRDQVRKPMYGSSVARWKRYEKHLGPLLDGLE